MAARTWKRDFEARVRATPTQVFDLLADMPRYSDWLPGSPEFDDTVDVEPYPVQLGTRYRDGKPNEEGKYWLGSVTRFERPKSLDFQHTINVPAARATLDAHIHYIIEPDGGDTAVTRSYRLEVTAPTVLLPLRWLAQRRITNECERVMHALASHFASLPIAAD